MAAAITTYYINKLWDNLITQALADGTMTVALSTTEPQVNDAATSGLDNVTEPTGGSYARITLTGANWSAAADRAKSTSSNITFPAPTADWGSIGWVVLYAGTRAIFFAPLAEIVDVTAYGDQINIPAGTLSLAAPL